jgi:hypothetical protein
MPAIANYSLQAQNGRETKGYYQIVVLSNIHFQSFFAKLTKSTEPTKCDGQCLHATLCSAKTLY